MTGETYLRLATRGYTRYEIVITLDVRNALERGPATWNLEQLAIDAFQDDDDYVANVVAIPVGATPEARVAIILSEE